MMKKQLPNPKHQDYLDILSVALKAETYSILDAERINKIMFRVKNNLGLIEDLSSKKKGPKGAIERNYTSFWLFVFIAFLLLTFKIVIENYLYKPHF